VTFWTFLALLGVAIVVSATVGAGVAVVLLRRGRPALTAGGPTGSDAPLSATTRPEPTRVDAPPAVAERATSLDDGPDHESFGYIVSHDLRAPIRVVEGFTRIVKEDYAGALDRLGHDHLDRVLGAAARMNSMIDALLALSRLSSQPIARRPVNLSQLAGYVVDDLRRQSPDREVEVEIEPGLLTVGDPTLLRTVLENLLGNAWKYSANAEPARIGFVREPGSGTTFTVRDNGVGFDMRFAERLFGVFQRLHSASEFPGTGVGLASVRRIVQRHGGTVWAEAELDKGARFHFTLPLATTETTA
jgi:light-regulated signal transduction histidine kinase (bacteriophytochrome)